MWLSSLKGWEGCMCIQGAVRCVLLGKVGQDVRVSAVCNREGQD